MENKSNLKPRLVAPDGAARREPIDLTLEDGVFFVIGRDSLCDLPIGEAAISRKHCRIFRDADNFYLEDLESHNGTFVNDASVTTRRIVHGDQIRIGSAHFMFLTEKDDAVTAQARFDDGALMTNSMIRIFPNSDTINFPSDLNVLVKLGKALKEKQEPEAFQRKILEIILGFIPAQRGAILITDDDLSEPEAVCVLAKNFFDTAPMQISRTVSSQVLREQVALLSNDLSDKNLEKSLSLMISRVSSLLCVPMKIGEKKGLIYLDTSDLDVQFIENHLEQMTAVSYLVSAGINSAESINDLRRENEILKDSLQIETNMVGESDALKEIFRMISRVAASNSTVLITGESGTGKELAAKAIHQNSPRKSKPFIAINCAALNENLLESELFGHEKGAFTGADARKKGKLEVADNGTVFLDEIGEMSLALQVKLLRVLQEREFERVGGTEKIKVKVRVIAATNRNLEEEVRKGAFRADLFYRLNVVPIRMPSLRERKSDIPLLARHFIQKYSDECHRKIEGLSAEAQRALVAFDWQGNIRELENAVERAVVLGTNNKIKLEDLPKEISEKIAPETASSGDFNEQLRQAKRRIIVSAIGGADGNFTSAARHLGMHPNNLHRLVRELGIKDELGK